MNPAAHEPRDAADADVVDPAALIAPKGVYAAVATPLTDRLEPNLPVFVRHCRWLLANGCDGLAMLGTTGEANSLGMDQRLDLIEAAIDAGLPPARLMPGTGACALADAVALTRAAVTAGCGGVLMLPPFYYKNPSADGLYRFFAEVIERIGDARLRLYLYHIPPMSQVAIPAELVARLLRDYPGVVVGLKDSGGDFAYSKDLLARFPGFAVYSGSEELMLANLQAGGAGCISATVNLTAPLAQAVYRAWAAGDAAAEARQAELTPVRLAFQRHPLIGALKSALAELTGDAGWRNLLPPLAPLTEAPAAELVARLRAVPQLRDMLPG